MKNKIEAIIFDLGSVLLNVDYESAKIKFLKNGIEIFDETNQTEEEAQIIFDFEKGKISEEEFFNCLKTFTTKQIKTTQLKRIWNSMLLDFPPQRIQMLKEVRKNYKIFLLSNTNITHYRKYSYDLKKTYQTNLASMFDGVYLSFLLGMRKPEVEIFRKVLNDNLLQPQQTFFIDDNLNNIQQAISLGINSYHLQQEEEVCNLFINGKINQEYLKTQNFIL